MPALDPRSGRLKIQPDYDHDGSGVIPYPFWIDPATGAVARQEFWKGNPSRLLGFTSSTDRFELDLTLRQFAAGPDRAAGMFPVFSTSGGDIFTLATPARDLSA